MCQADCRHEPRHEVVGARRYLNGRWRLHWRALPLGPPLAQLLHDVRDYRALLVRQAAWRGRDLALVAAGLTRRLGAAFACDVRLDLVLAGRALPRTGLALTVFVRVAADLATRFSVFRFGADLGLRAGLDFGAAFALR